MDPLRLRCPPYLASEPQLEAHHVRRCLDPRQRTRTRHHFRSCRSVQARCRLPEGAVRERVCEVVLQAVPPPGAREDPQQEAGVVGVPWGLVEDKPRKVEGLEDICVALV
jgi:hypothetical protein